MITVGVDFAAAARNTAACTLRWQAGAVVVERVDGHVDDDAFVALLDGLGADGRLGIDCPLGWPVAFVAAVSAHGEHRPWPGGGCDERSPLLWRETDRWVRDNCGKWPLSVSTDRIGVTALRAACLLDRWGGSVDRSGLTGPVVEVYPAVARRGWGLSAERLVEEVEVQLPRLRFEEDGRRSCLESEHAFDALVAGLVARAAALGRTSPPPHHLRPIAEVEGWIQVPACRLEALLGPLTREQAGPVPRRRQAIEKEEPWASI